MGESKDADYAADYSYACKSDHTVVFGSLTSSDNFADFFLYSGSQDGEVDIQAQTLIGYSTRVQCGAAMFVGPTARVDFTGLSSGWSNTQTINLKSTPTTRPAQQGNQNNVSFKLECVLLTVLAAILLVASLMFWRKSTSKKLKAEVT